MVEYVDRIQPELELLRFMDFESLDQIHVEADTAGSSYRRIPKCPNFSRLWIHQNGVPVRSDKGFVAVCRIQSVRPGNTGIVRILDLAKATEVDNAVGHLRNRAHSLW